MAGRGLYQKQLAAIVAAAAADNLTIDSILPGEVQKHFRESKELMRAQERILELEGREQELQAANKHLTDTVNARNIQIDNLHEDHEARKIELQQTHRQVEVHKEVNQIAEERVERYRQQLKEIVNKQQTDDTATKKIQDLQTQVANQEATIAKLVDDMNKSEALFKDIRQCDKNALERVELQLAKKDQLLAEQEDVINELQQHVQNTIDDKAMLEELDPVALQEQNVGLEIQNVSLSEDNKALQDQYSIVKEQLREILTAEGQDHKAQLFAAAISETKTLNRFYKAAFQVLDALSSSFREGDSDIPSRPCIEDHLDIAQEALGGYRDVKDAVRAVTDAAGILDPDQAALYAELDSMAMCAANAMGSIETLNYGFWTFLNDLSDDPKLLANLNGALCAQGRFGTARVKPVNLNGGTGRANTLNLNGTLYGQGRFGTGRVNIVNAH